MIKFYDIISVPIQDCKSVDHVSAECGIYVVYCILAITLI
jgi:hypothetical protein